MNKSYLNNLENDVTITFRISKEVRTLFNDYCKANMLNSSAVIRELIIDFIIKNSTDNK